MSIPERKITEANCIITRFANGMLSSIFLSFALFLCFSHPFCSARDTLTEDDPIIDDGSEGLVSAGGKFELGFFSLTGSFRRYVGIWYHNLTPTTVVWVANRDNPLIANHTGVLAINQGTLRVSDKKSGESLWSAENQQIKDYIPINLTVKLKDDGNLVLSDTIALDLWQSFENPTDTFIPGMRMDKSLNLTSWNGVDDPGPGNFTFSLDGDKQYMIKKLTKDYWRSSDANFFSSDEMPAAVAHLLSKFSKNDSTKSSSIFRNGSQFYNGQNFLPPSEYSSTRLVIDFTGKLNWFTYTQKHWSLTWFQPRDDCSVFNPCGDSGICNINNKPICRCLPGFKPLYQNKWESGDFSGGCTRESLLCSSRIENDNFISMNVTKVINSDTQTPASESECRDSCFKNCQCQAYSYRKSELVYDRTYPCLIWDLTVPSNLQEKDYDSHNLYVRIAGSDPEGNHQEPTKPSVKDYSRRKIPLFLIIVAILVSVIVLACIISIYIWRIKMNKRQDQISRTQLDSERQVKSLIETSEFKEEDGKGIDVPFFYLQSILEATDNFSDAN